jgi:hypothetical protein
VSAGTSVITYTVAGSIACPSASTSTTITVTNEQLTTPSNNGDQTICIGATANLVAYNSSAVDMDGSNDYIQSANGVYFDDNTYTIEGWVYVKAHQNWQRLIDFGNVEQRNNW